MDNTLSEMHGFKEMQRLIEQKYTAHDYQSSQFIQDVLPFLQEVEQTIDRMAKQIDRLEDKVEKLSNR